MDSGAAVLVLLSVLVLCRGEEQIKAVSGSDVTFRINLIVPYTEINWFIDNSRIVDLEQGRNPEYYRWEDRVDVDFKQKTLTLKKVTNADSGLYRGVLVDMGKLSPSTFNLQVYDPVCQVGIINITAGNNVTLLCVCVKFGAAPTKYEWYLENPTIVLTTEDITVDKKEVEQKIRCVASNEVSKSNATIIVPRNTPDKKTNKSAIICGVLIPVIIIAFLVVLYKYTRKKKGTLVTVEHIEQSEKLNLVKDDTPCGLVDMTLFSNESSEISVMKDGTFVMGVTLHSPSFPLERLIVQQETLTIMDLEEEDYGTYTAETLSSTSETATSETATSETATTVFIARESAQNGKIRGEDGSDDGAELVNPVDGELNLKIPNAAKVIWKKDGDELLTVIYSVDPVLHPLVLYRGALRVPLMSGVNDKYKVHVRQSNSKSGLYEFSVNVIDIHKKQQEKRETEIKICSFVNFNPPIGVDTAVDVTFCPVNVEKAKKITWKKDNDVLVQWEKPNVPNPAGDKKATLDPASGNLTLKNLQEKDRGKYIMEAEAECPIVQKFSLAIHLEQPTGS